MHSNNQADKWEISSKNRLLILQTNTFLHIDTPTLDDNYSHLFYGMVMALTTPVSKWANAVGVLEVYESNKNYLTAKRHREVVSADLAK
jgi:hypothetical protein